MDMTAQMVKRMATMNMMAHTALDNLMTEKAAIQPLRADKHIGYVLDKHAGWLKKKK